MSTGILLLLVISLLLSAFFSGLETAFYRATRVRLVLDALAGSLIARCLVWLTNRPTVFVATILVGNNLANYLTSLAIVMGTQMFCGAESHVAELLAPLALAPILFIYGELLPKNLCLQAPNRLLRLGSPLFMVFLVLFLPASLLLWLLNQFMAHLVSEPPEQVRLTLARRELQGLLTEGREAGILHPAQQSLARNIFALSVHQVEQLATSLRDVPRARADMAKAEVLRLANRYRIADIPIESTGPERDLIGYVRVIDLALSDADDLEPIRPLIEIPASSNQIDAMVQMENAGHDLARVVDAQGRTVGILTARSLRRPLFQVSAT